MYFQEQKTIKSRYVKRSYNAFTLVEILVVIGIIAVLAGVVLSVVFEARRRSHETTCLSNIRQIGAAHLLYAADYDDYPVWGGDPADLYGGVWGENADIASMQPQNIVLLPYTKNRLIWKCPSDRGFEQCEHCGFLPATSNEFNQYGTSYHTRTAIILLKKPLSSIEGTNQAGQTINTAQIHFFFDATGMWHSRGNKDDLSKYRYNTSFLDGHAKSLTYEEHKRLWSFSLR